MNFFLALIFYTILSVSPEIFAEISDTNNPMEKLNQKIDLSIAFTNQDNKVVTLKDLLLNKKALIITHNFFACTSTCNIQYSSLAKIITEKKLEKNKWAIASFSFNPDDKPKKAKNLQEAWQKRMGPNPAHWDFLVGTPESIEKLTKFNNFSYEKDKDGEYIHAGGLYFFKENGTFHRYLHGNYYKSIDFFQALIETSHLPLGSFYDRLKIRTRNYNEDGQYKSVFDFKLLKDMTTDSY